MGLYLLNGIIPKLNVIAWLKFELVYNTVEAQHVSHYTTGNHPLWCQGDGKWWHKNINGEYLFYFIDFLSL